MNFVSILWLVFVISRATTDRVIKPLPNVVAIVGKPFVHLLSKINGADIQYKVTELCLKIRALVLKIFYVRLLKLKP